MASERIRIGVLGCASIAWRRMLPAFKEAEGVELTAVASRDRRKALRFAERFRCAASEGYSELIDRADIDAVYIPLPASLHAQWASRSLSAGKHVLVEKPLARDAREARELIAQARQAGLWLMENFAFLHHAQHETVQSLAADGRLGELRTLSASFGIPHVSASDIRSQAELGGGALLDVGVYPIRLAQLLLGPELTVAGAVLRRRTSVDVAGHALLVAASGVTAELSFGFEHSYRCRYELWGSTGHLRLERAFTPGPAWQPVIRIESQDHAEELFLPPDHQFRNLAEAFSRAVRGGADFTSRAAAMLRQAELVDEVRARAARGAPEALRIAGENSGGHDAQ